MNGKFHLKAVICASLGEGPVPDHFRALALALRDRGHTAILATWHSDGVRQFGPTGIEMLRFPSTRPTGVRDMFFLRKTITDRSANCIVANFGAVNTAAVVGWNLRIPIRVAWYHTLQSQIAADHVRSNLRHGLQVARKRLMYSFCSHIVANSRASVEELKSYWRIPEHKIMMFWNTMPDPGRRHESYKRKSGLIVCAGRLNPSKGQDILLRALAELRDDYPAARAVFLGDGPYRGDLEMLSATLGIQDRVSFLGTVSHDEVLDAMAEASIVAVPSRSEAFGNTNIEALSVGVPVVASRVGGIPEVVRDGLDGLLFEGGNPKSMAESLKRLLRDSVLSGEMGRNGRKRFLELFETQSVIAKQVDWLEGLVGEPLST